jgi:hypothetical protein
VNDVRISRIRPRLEQRPRRRNVDVARLEQAREDARREASWPRLI